MIEHHKQKMASVESWAQCGRVPFRWHRTKAMQMGWCVARDIYSQLGNNSKNWKHRTAASTSNRRMRTHPVNLYAFHCSKSHTRTHTPPPAPPPPLLLTETLKTLAHLFSSIRGSDSDISFVHFLCNQTDFNWYFVHFLRGREFAAGRVCHR